MFVFYFLLSSCSLILVFFFVLAVVEYEDLRLKCQENFQKVYHLYLVWVYILNTAGC